MTGISFFPNYYFENKQSVDKVTESIHNSEIFSSSQCLSFEVLAIKSIEKVLQEHSYSEISDDHKLWSNNKKTIILSLVDDYRNAGGYMLANPSKGSHITPWLFNGNTVVITDNYVSCPTQYPVVRLPESFFGIYNYTPKTQEFAPEKDMFFSVNRIDQLRMFLYFEFMIAYGSPEAFSQSAYINFNCAHYTDRAATLGQRNSFFNELWSQVDSKSYSGRYQHYADIAKYNVPYLNYSQNYDDMFYRSWLNVIVETYSNDYVIAFSEKIFRALVTPAPWVLCGAPHSVAYLKSLGFDVLDDVVDHIEYDADILPDQKLANLASMACITVKKLKSKNFKKLKHRCDLASQHNIALLAKLNQQWPKDFSSWLTDLPKFIS